MSQVVVVVVHVIVVLFNCFWWLLIRSIQHFSHYWLFLFQHRNSFPLSSNRWQKRNNLTRFHFRCQFPNQTSWPPQSPWQTDETDDKRKCQRCGHRWTHRDCTSERWWDVQWAWCDEMNNEHDMSDIQWAWCDEMYNEHDLMRWAWLDRMGMMWQDEHDVTRWAWSDEMSK